ncbi:MAG: hypothetical protein KIPDCIKN_04344 [Haliscomenobacter sp.]|nr:hypothetical protein [Haliscomenobacter sp.]
MAKITLLKATNFKRIDEVTIETGGKRAVLIRGANRGGKTSALDALVACLVGRGELPEDAVNHASPKSPAVLLTKIEGTSVGTLTVKRRITAKGSDLKVEAESADGTVATLSPPQSALDAVLGAVSIRPMDILNTDRAKRLKALTTAGGVAEPFDRLEKERKAAVSARTEAARELDRKQKNIGAKPAAPPAVPAEPPGTDPQLVEKSALLASQRKALDGHRADHERISRDIAQKEEQVSRLQAEIKAMGDSLRHTAAAGVAVKADVERLTIELMPLQEQEASLSDRRKAWAQQDADRRVAVANMEAWERSQKAASEAERDLESKTEAVTRLDEQITALIAGSTLSQIPGLSITPEGEVMLNGVPLSQASGAEQVLFGARLALAANPKLPIIAIDEADCLDNNAIKALVDFAAESDLQVWMTGVRLPGDEVHAEILAVDMVDGRNGPATTEAEKEKASGAAATPPIIADIDL